MRQHREGNIEGHTQSQENRRNAEPESQSMGYHFLKGPISGEGDEPDEKGHG